MLLLDVNLLIALLDEWHPHHACALAFFPRAQARGRATCPITENGFLRIVGHPNYRRDRARRKCAHAAGSAVRQLRHQFGPNSATLRDERRVAKLATSGHPTDVYLLALVAERRGKLATFDRRIDPAWAVGGAKVLLVLPA